MLQLVHMFLYNLETRTEAQKQTTAAIMTSFSDEFETFFSQKLSNIFKHNWSPGSTKSSWSKKSKNVLNCLYQNQV